MSPTPGIRQPSSPSSSSLLHSHPHPILKPPPPLSPTKHHQPKRRLLVPLLILAGIVFASALQTEFASYLAKNQSYHKPYLTFYLTHISFVFVFPVHLGVLYVKSGRDWVKLRTQLRGLKKTVVYQLQLQHHQQWSTSKLKAQETNSRQEMSSPSSSTLSSFLPTTSVSSVTMGWENNYTSSDSLASPGPRTPIKMTGSYRIRDTELALVWARRVTLLTTLLSLPALSWYVAMALAPAMDVTALYATSSFHAYFFSMAIIKHGLSRMTMGSIVAAFFGVLVLTLDAGSGGGDDLGGESGRGEGHKWGSRLIGDMIMAFGAAALGLYEVIYKILLPQDHPIANSTSSANPKSSSFGRPVISSIGSTNRQEGDDEDEVETFTLSSDRDRQDSHTPLLNESVYPEHSVSVGDVSDLATSNALDEDEEEEEEEERGNDEDEGDDIPPPLPLIHPPQVSSVLHANFLTSCIGIATLLVFWIPIPILHLTGVEQFHLPSAGEWASMAMVCFGGSSYNAGLMVLIGIWGPTTSSVANLLTIGLVAIADAIWMGNIPDLQTLMGAALICVGFAVLLWEGGG